MLKNNLFEQNQDVSNYNLDMFLTSDNLISEKNIPIKYSEYKISTPLKDMLISETIGVSHKKVIFSAGEFFESGKILRIWFEIPNYWERKAQLVYYRQTVLPTYFQVISKVILCPQTVCEQDSYHVHCDILHIDAIDERILKEYLQPESLERAML